MGKQGSNEYNDLFQCHLDAQNSQNILFDMSEIRTLFCHKVNFSMASDENNGSELDCNEMDFNRTRHRPHRVGKEGYKPLKDLIDCSQYVLFRDSLRSHHSQFDKNCLDIYCDDYNKELYDLDTNRLFTIGSLSCLDIRPSHYLSPSWKEHK